MKEYKLSRTSKYSVLYLLSGLFMFFFMFAILNLSSYAKTTSFNLKTANPRPTSFDGSCTVSFGTPSFTVNIPQDSSLQQAQSKTFYYSTNLYVTTTAGTFLLRTDDYNFNATVYPNQGNTFTSDLHMSGIGSFYLQGQFISADLILDSDDVFDYYTFNGTETGSFTNGSYPTYRGSVYGSMRSELKGFGISSVNSTFVSVSSSSSGDSDISSFISDYSSYSLLTSSVPVSFYDSFSTSVVPVGSGINYSFADLNTTQLCFTDMYIPFGYRNSTQVMFFIYYEADLYSTSSYLQSLDFLYLNSLDNVEHHLSLSDFKIYQGYRNKSGGISMLYGCTIDLPSVDSYTTVVFRLNSAIAGRPVSKLSFVGYQYKMTINDYMDYVKNNYDSLSPSVTDLNQNTSRSVSDIGTAQTFETSAFDNFNNQMSSSGLDSFSLSYASTPLLWVSSIITNFYNNMPATFQYLLMFVAFIGILCTVLNVFGRVAQRFGGDNPNKANSKDVFSYIEKHGSI